MHTFKKWMNYIAIILLDYLVSILVVYMLLYKPGALPQALFFTIEQGLTSQAALHIGLTVFSFLLGVLFFVLKRSDNALARKPHKMRLVLETGKRHIGYADLAVWVWSILLLLVVVGLFFPVYPLASLPYMGVIWQFGAPPPFIALYDPLVLHQLFVLTVSFQLLRELWRLKQNVLLPVQPSPSSERASERNTKEKPLKNSDVATVVGAEPAADEAAQASENSGFTMNDAPREAADQAAEGEPTNE